jgi:anthranilate phosphoribosyltransferase
VLNSVHWVNGHETTNATAALTTDAARRLMGEMLSGSQTADQIREFLVAYNDRSATSDELSGFLQAVRDAATPVDLPTEIAARALDIVGTGGDRSGSVNISTMAALVVAGAGVPVCKHGNRSASSKCGTADVLEALGARIELTPDQVRRSVEEVGFGFVFAPAFHPAFRHVGPVRRELGVPTVFNLIGPMANPAAVSYMLVGVANPEHMMTMANVVAQRTAASLIVHGHGGIDELSLAGPNRVMSTHHGQTDSETVIDPSDYGLAPVSNDLLRGGDAQHNAGVVREVLGNRLHGPIRDVVVLNAGVALCVAGLAMTPSEGIARADDVIARGAAIHVLESFVAISNLKP